MLASELISKDILSGMKDDSGEAIMVMMGLFHVRHLPIVENEKLIGIISEDEIYTHDVSQPIGGYLKDTSVTFVDKNDHLFEVLGVLSENKLSMVPVLNEQDQYLGVVSQSDILHYYATSFSFSEPGSIVLLEVPKIDYSLEEISRLIESEGAAILSSLLSEIPNSENTILVTLKINKMDISDIIFAFERHDYVVISSFSEEDFEDELTDNYNHLMKYLDV